MKGFIGIIILLTFILNGCTTDNIQNNCERPIGVVSYKNNVEGHKFLLLTKYCQSDDGSENKSGSFSDLQAGNYIESQEINVANYKIYSDATNARQGIEVSEAFQKGDNSPLTEEDYNNHKFVVELILPDGRNNFDNPIFDSENSEYLFITPDLETGGLSLEQLKEWTSQDKEFDFHGTSLILNAKWASPNYVYASLESMEDLGEAMEWEVKMENDKPMVYYAKLEGSIYVDDKDRIVDASNEDWSYLEDNKYSFMKGDIVKYNFGKKTSIKEDDFLPKIEDREKEYVYGKYSFSSDNKTFTIKSVDGVDASGNIKPFEESAEILKFDGFKNADGSVNDNREVKLLIVNNRTQNPLPESDKRVIVTLRPVGNVTYDEFYN